MTALTYNTLKSEAKYLRDQAVRHEEVAKALKAAASGIESIITAESKDLLSLAATADLTKDPVIE